MNANVTNTGRNGYNNTKNAGETSNDWLLITIIWKATEDVMFVDLIIWLRTFQDTEEYCPSSNDNIIRMIMTNSRIGRKENNNEGVISCYNCS